MDVLICWKRIRVDDIVVLGIGLQAILFQKTQRGKRLKGCDLAGIQLHNRIGIHLTVKEPLRLFLVYM